jgi:hypothetical protein
MELPTGEDHRLPFHGRRVVASSQKDTDGAPANVGPTRSTGSARAGEYLTTAQGLRLADTDHSLLRDGMHQIAVHVGMTPYRPNSIDGGEPLPGRARRRGRVRAGSPPGRRHRGLGQPGIIR